MTRNARTINKDLQRVVAILVKQFDPEKIILFGSHARGHAGPESDLDLLVVMPVQGSKRQKQLEVRMALPRTRVAVDVIVTRPEDYGWRKNTVGTIEWPAAREGKLLHARA